MSRRDEYVEQMKNQLDSWNEQLDHLQEQVTQFQGEAKTGLQDRLQIIRGQMQEAKGKLKALQAVGEDRWESTRSELESLRGALTSSFNYFKSQI